MLVQFMSLFMREHHIQYVAITHTSTRKTRNVARISCVTLNAEEASVHQQTRNAPYAIGGTNGRATLSVFSPVIID